MTEHRYPRRIPLAVTGLTPQVVTEILYALAVQRQPAFIRLTAAGERVDLAFYSLMAQRQCQGKANIMRLLGEFTA